MNHPHFNRVPAAQQAARGLGRTLAIALTAAMGSASACGTGTPAPVAEPTPPAYEGYELVWHDEFEADGPPNPAHWSAETRGFVRNNELQWYQEENAFCRDGHLIIEARREHRPSPMHDPHAKGWRQRRTHIEYTSALVHTRGKQQWLYGRFEIRAKLDTDPGLWPAIWTLGTARKWPGNGEIDIMEYYQGHILANAAWSKHVPDKPWAARWDAVKVPIEQLKDPEGWSERFHVWRMDWDEDYIRIYLDDQLINEIDLARTFNETGDRANPFREPHYLLLNLALGGDNGGDPSQTQFPRRYVIDYVRVYQKAPRP